ncbi:ribose-phosphate pyrophosphokinase [Aureibacter tunicatorum]|uniref:Ribose-phosphate pyrophosphokinase n=1 Tax=Aureibacter tunicatorum TaxID=866807 RepID=A0AAE3XLQ3_9BACT|nr:ribose-phosphate pyrophosphokinase [Aureibacter tunicatorum]MDR6238289.1 ribose-phosphate pyrophosphokinase [Aureibacter tunicatorum]BDD03322.1 ribose-phosphate pyrophosphokinase [Aureibacter tunicatorum]
MSAVKIFSGTNSRYLAEQIAHCYGTTLGDVDILKFSDGEIAPNFNDSVRGCDVFLVQSTFAPADNLMELLLMIDACRRASAKYVTVVAPYFGYARQDRKDKPRVPIGAKLVANLLTAAGANRLMTCDLHAGQIQGFFDIPVDHMDGSYIFVPYIKSLNLENLIFAAPDVGGTGRARNFAKVFTADMVICDKHRKRANEVASMQVIGDVEGKDVILVDDICDTGGTLCKAASLLKEKGANSVRAVCTHPVLSGKAYDNIANSELEELIVTDSIPLKQECEKIKVLSVADLFSRAIRKLHDNESISSLFLRD